MLLKDVEYVVAARGQKVTCFDLKRDPPAQDLLYRNLLGPTGNLRAPCFKQGKTLYVGFHEDAFRQRLL